MATPSLGLVGAYGAAGAAEGLEGFLKRRIEEQIAQRQMAEVERRARAQEAAEAARLAQAQAEMAQQGTQFNQRLGLDTEELGERRRQFDAGANQRGLDLMKGEAEIGEITNARSAREALKNNPVYGKVVGLRSAGVPTAPIDPMDPTGDIGHGRSLERIDRAAEGSIRAAGAARAGRREMTPNQEVNLINRLNQQYNTNTKAQRVIQNQFGLMDSAMKDIESGRAKDLNAASQAILVTFQKVLDPESVVRETEYARSPNGQSLLAAIEGKMRAVTEGGPGVLRENLSEFVRLAKSFSEQSLASINAEKGRIGKIADAYQLDQSLIFPEDSGGAGTGTGESLDTNPPVSAPQKTVRVRNKRTGEVKEVPVGPDGRPIVP